MWLAPIEASSSELRDPAKAKHQRTISDGPMRRLPFHLALTALCLVPTATRADLFEERQVLSFKTERLADMQSVDVDGDGDEDIVLISTDLGRVVWVENRGGAVGLAGHHLLVQLPDDLIGVVFVDVDGDGDLDLVTAGAQFQRVLLFRNDAGHFIQQPEVAVGGGVPSELGLGDVDQDGDTDLVIAYSSPGRVVWRENLNGQAAFGSERTVVGSLGSTMFVGLALADIDGDGDLDVAVGSRSQGRITWQENVDGLGGVWSEHVVDPGYSDLAGLEQFDADGDGDPDLVARSSSLSLATIDWFENLQPNGTFSARTSLPTASSVQEFEVADPDGDNDLDLLAIGADGISWFENTDGQGLYANEQPLLDGPVTGPNFAPQLTRGDWNGDGVDDIATYTGDGWLEWYASGGGGALTNRPPSLISADPNHQAALVVGDLDGDGDLDLARRAGTPVDTGAALLIQENDGTGVFFGGQVVGSPSAIVRNLDLGDVDGDGDLDLLFVGNGSPSLQVTEGLGWLENPGVPGAWSQHLIGASGVEGWDAVWADVDGDGDRDVVEVRHSPEDLVWYSNMDGQGLFGLPVLLDTFGSTGQGQVEAHDMDGDGDLEILCRSGSGPRPVSLYPNLGGGSFGLPVQVDPDANHFRVGDLDSDGWLDVLIRRSSNVTWRRNLTGLGSFGAEQVIADGIPWNHADGLLLDVDVDGDLDVAVFRFAQIAARVYRNQNGSGVLTGPTTFGGDLAGVSRAWSMAGALGAPPDLLVSAVNGDALLSLVNRSCGSPIDPIQFITNGIPPNPDALRADLADGPRIGDVWEPFIDHSLFQPTAVLDVLVVSSTAAVVPLPAIGTLLVGLSPGYSTFLAPAAGAPFGVEVPQECALIGGIYLAQAASLQPDIGLRLTNGIIVRVGSL